MFQNKVACIEFTSVFLENTKELSLVVPDRDFSCLSPKQVDLVCPIVYSIMSQMLFKAYHADYVKSIFL